MKSPHLSIYRISSLKIKDSYLASNQQVICYIHLKSPHTKGWQRMGYKRQRFCCWSAHERSKFASPSAAAALAPLLCNYGAPPSFFYLILTFPVERLARAILVWVAREIGCALNPCVCCRIEKHAIIKSLSSSFLPLSWPGRQMRRAPSWFTLTLN